MSKQDAEIIRLNIGWSEANSTILDRDVEIVGLKDYIQKLETARNMLSGLVHYLTNNYGDDHWDSTTRELLEEANDYIGNQPIVWNIEDEPDYSAEMPEGYVR